LFLVDTKIISAGAPGKTDWPGARIDWMDRNSDRRFLSVITVAEIEDAIAKARREGATRKADRLADWRDALLHLYAVRIPSLDIAVARVLGALSDHARGSGQSPGWADLAIAATARSRGLTVLTRNLRHFQPLGTPVINPFETLPARQIR
jgi:predicted nucleic acid-binding protein